jgi:hypothetical protein
MSGHTAKPTKNGARVAPRRSRTTTHEEIPDELVFSAAKQITICCGESSITLTAAGKIILRGKYIVSRSSGVQRIKGGSVQIN